MLDTDHDRTFLWLLDHPGYLDAYPGEWVALDGPEVVGHAVDPVQALAQAKAAGVDDPLMVPVMADEFVVG